MRVGQKKRGKQVSHIIFKKLGRFLPLHTRLLFDALVSLNVADEKH